MFADCAEAGRINSDLAFLLASVRIIIYKDSDRTQYALNDVDHVCFFDNFIIKY